MSFFLVRLYPQFFVRRTHVLDEDYSRNASCTLIIISAMYVGVRYFPRKNGTSFLINYRSMFLQYSIKTVNTE